MGLALGPHLRGQSQACLEGLRQKCALPLGVAGRCSEILVCGIAGAPRVAVRQQVPAWTPVEYGVHWQRKDARGIAESLTD